MALVYSPPRKINSSSSSRFACIWYTGTAAAMKMDAAVMKKIKAGRAKPACDRWTCILFDDRQRLAAVIFKIFDIDGLVGNPQNPVPAHQHFTDGNVVMPRIVREKCSESATWSR